MKKTKDNVGRLWQFAIPGYGIAIFFISTYYWAEWWMFFSFLCSWIGFLLALIPILVFISSSDIINDKTELKDLNAVSVNSLIISMIGAIIAFFPIPTIWDDYESSIFSFIMLVTTGVMIVGLAFRCLVSLSGGNKKLLKGYKQKRQGEKSQAEMVKKVRLQYQSEHNKLVAKYGEPTNSYILKPNSINDDVYVFGDTQIAYVCGKELAFKDILSCTFSDDYSIQKGKVEYNSNTKTDTGSMVSRAVVGGVLLGGAGAVIGGSTANKTTNTITHQEDDTIKHSYTVIININSLSNPIVRIDTKDNGKLTNDIVGVMNVIIGRNQKNKF